MLYIRFPKFIYLAKLKLNPVSQFLQLLIFTILPPVSVTSASLDSTYDWGRVFCLSVVWLTQSAQCLLGLCLLLQMENVLSLKGWIIFFLYTTFLKLILSSMDTRLLPYPIMNNSADTSRFWFHFVWVYTYIRSGIADVIWALVFKIYFFLIEG